MGRLGASNVNVNVNVAAGGVRDGGMPARYNSHLFAKVIKPHQFPLKNGGKGFEAAQVTANRVRFREYWDAELRASVYLNEFVSKNPDWLGKLIAAIEKAGWYEKLHNEKGDQLRQVINAAGEREERFAEIIDQHEADGAIKYWLGMLMVDASSVPATYQLVRAARRIGELVVMCLKDHYREARPSQVCPAIVPMIDPPVTPSFPSGHALQSHLISTCLAAVGRPRNQRDMLDVLARRIAQNRVVAGLHYPFDNDAGELAAQKCFELLRDGTEFKALVLKAKKEVTDESEAKSKHDVQVERRMGR